MTVEIEIRLPEGIFREPGVLDFVKFLDEGGIKDEARQRGIVEALLIERVRGVGERYVRAMGRQITEITHLRDSLRSRYRAVVEHFRSGKTAAQLGPELQPAAFDALYAELGRAVDGLETPASFVRKTVAAQPAAPRAARPTTAAATDLHDSLRRLERRFGPTMEVHPEGPRLYDRLEGIRALLDRGEIAEAQTQLAALRRDLDAARVTLLNQGTVAFREADLEAQSEGLSPYERTPLRSREGLRMAPADLIAEGAPALPPDRIQISREPFQLEHNQIELARILQRADRGEPTAAGIEFEAFIRQHLPNEPAVLRAGRRPDVGATEITLEGRDVGFTPRKVQQLWLDLTDLREIDLIVPRLSERALLELRRIGARAEAMLQVPGRPRVEIRIRVLEVGP